MKRQLNSSKKDISKTQNSELLKTLQARFETNMKRHKGIEWQNVQKMLEANKDKLCSLFEMERTGGEPDCIGHDRKTGEYLFCDCSEQSPSGRRSLPYDMEGQKMREKEGIKMAGNAVDQALAMRVKIMSEEEYMELQKLGDFDTKTSSWLRTPPEIRKLGGAIFGDKKFGRAFVFHNGAESFYAARGWRGLLRV